MSELEPTTRALLAASRNADEPLPDELSRVERSLMLKIAAGAGASVSIGAATAKAAGAPLALKLASGVLFLGLATGAAVVLTKHEPAAPAVEPRVGASALTPQRGETAQRTPEPSARAVEAALSSAPQVSEAKAAAKRDAASKPESPALRLKAEAALVGDAQRALGAGRAGEALERLAQYDQRFPGGALRSEADATRVFALCQSGRRSEAESAKLAFLRRYPASPATPRVRSACSGSK